MVWGHKIAGSIPAIPNKLQRKNKMLAVIRTSGEIIELKPKGKKVSLEALPDDALVLLKWKTKCSGGIYENRN